MAFVYMVRCADDSLYTGYTLNIRKRLKSHYYRDIHCARYTRSHPVKELVCLWETESPSAARKLEYRIKHMQSAEKRALIQTPEQVKEFFPNLAEYCFFPVLGVKLEDYI